MAGWNPADVAVQASSDGVHHLPARAIEQQVERDLGDVADRFVGRSQANTCCEDAAETHGAHSVPGAGA